MTDVETETPRWNIKSPLVTRVFVGAPRLAGPRAGGRGQAVTETDPGSAPLGSPPVRRTGGERQTL